VPKKSYSSTAALRSAFGQTVRELRLKAGLTQEKLAHELKIDRGNLAKAEAGRHNPSMYTMVRLLPGLRVTMVEFAEEYERNLRAARAETGLGYRRTKKVC
jgi:transcriptional regulator with XRE-family HTH domain